MNPGHDAIFASATRLAAAFAEARRRHPLRTWTLEPLSPPLDERGAVEAVPSLRNATHRFVSALVTRYVRSDVAFVLELGAENNHPHAHVAAMGSRFRDSFLRDAAELAGVHLCMKGSGVVEKPVGFAFYLWKSFLSTLMLPEPEATQLLDLYLAFNGGELVACTPGLLGDVPSVITPEELETQAALRVELAEHFLATFDFAGKTAPVVVDAFEVLTFGLPAPPAPEPEDDDESWALELSLELAPGAVASGALGALDEDGHDGG